jgi:hypothetical protein
MFTPLILAGSLLITAFSILILNEAISIGLNTWTSYGRHKHLLNKYFIYKHHVDDWAKTHVICKNLQTEIEDAVGEFESNFVESELKELQAVFKYIYESLKQTLEGK